MDDTAKTSQVDSAGEEQMHVMARIEVTPPENLELKLKAMEPLLLFIEAERRLRHEVEHLRRFPQIWTAQIEGLRKELWDENWKPRGNTLGPMLKMLSVHQGVNASVNLLPYFREQYDRCHEMRNAIAHGDWEEFERLGGLKLAYPLAKRLYELVFVCASDNELIRMGVTVQIYSGTFEWEWPELKPPSTGTNGEQGKRDGALESDLKNK